MSATSVSKTSKPVSLQRKLVQSSMLSSITAGIIALLLLVGISIYQTMQMQDEIMDEVSNLLLSSDISSHSGIQLDELSEEFDIQYQLKLGQQLLTETTDFDSFSAAQETVFLIDEHFSVAWNGKQLLRRFYVVDDQQRLTMYQPLSVRFQELANSSLGYFAALMVLWLLQWGIVNFSIRRQFKAIHRLSADIAEKNVNNLSLIQQSTPELKEFQPMVQQLNKMLKRLEQSIVAEQRFTADASHELRSPLSAIQMRLQVLNRKYGESDAALKIGLQQIQMDVSRGSQILENLLLLARLDPSNISELPKVKFQLNDLILEVLKSLEPFNLEKQIQFQLDVTDVQVIANKELLLSCLRNLLDNAIRYSEPHKSVFIDLRSESDQIYLSIENEGDGVPAEVLVRLGDRFYRELGTKTQGSGLGLSICKKIIELHQGTITFSASNYGGLKVNLVLAHQD
ncbi:MAG: HAMP domain-containing histidine kinase [Candidatus Acinetobacter avistercoris]|nr:HAMP domain-containing histidine kinase [Candidatus Acinetobacter avistercoris]